MRAIVLSLAMASIGAMSHAETLTLTPSSVTEWKSVFGQIETKDRVPARARIAGTVDTLDVSEGDKVTAGQLLATITDTKIDFQISALDARIEAVASRLETAQTDLTRGEALKERGVISNQRYDELQTAVDVLRGEQSAIQAERLVLERQIEEGQVLAPEDGVVLDVPVSRGSVINPGESVAVIGGGGTYLRLSIPERHAEALHTGDTIEIDGDGAMTGTLAKVYPLIEGGRVEADVDVQGLDARFVGRRVQVRLPVAERQALLVPPTALHQEAGLDFVTIETAHGPVAQVVIPGDTVGQGDAALVEIVTGLSAGAKVVIDHE
ncbi:efflux RND transporter periplasmic adaptor subunit [Donghicola sp. C2-DW-16]|uniref:Efflux RND transporter periplasmic adaptor subunit n=1 Tax=Donghicola mangrovi TaxID=2729614 RepID=A0ABX2PDG2_9RHOB|nr:efflux RND transporter periplasmic adaptor subunit [Donghicola mangrovi]NVO27507.1 efflux RND transporter periplasmic adaptor subunit [Donghicola mangrovi]